MKSLLLFALSITFLVGTSSAFLETFDTDPLLSDSQMPNTWYTDRSAPSGFVSEMFDGDNRLKISIDGDTQPSGSFYQTQGRKYDVNMTQNTQTVSIDLYVGPDWNTQDRYTGIWATGFDSSNAVSAYPILAFRNAEGDGPGFYSYDYDDSDGFYGWENETLISNFGQWYNLKFVLTVGTGVEYFLDGVSIGTFADTTTVSLGNVILNTKNYGQDYDVYYDNFVPEPMTMAFLGLGGLFLRKRK